MSDEPTTIALDQAEFGDLKYYAETHLGLEVKTGMNSGQLRAKILQAEPERTAIPYSPKQDEGPAAKPAAAVAPATSSPAGGKDAHPNHDPKVELTVNKTKDGTRSKSVTVSVNGVVWRMQRGQRISVPYRVYEALINATETAAVETDEINGITGAPRISWELVQSYEVTVHKLPTDEEVEEWRERTGGAIPLAA